MKSLVDYFAFRLYIKICYTIIFNFNVLYYFLNLRQVLGFATYEVYGVTRGLKWCCCCVSLCQHFLFQNIENWCRTGLGLKVTNIGEFIIFVQSDTNI